MDVFQQTINIESAPVTWYASCDTRSHFSPKLVKAKFNKSKLDDEKNECCIEEIKTYKISCSEQEKISKRSMSVNEDHTSQYCLMLRHYIRITDIFPRILWMIVEK